MAMIKPIEIVNVPNTGKTPDDFVFGVHAGKMVLSMRISQRLFCRFLCVRSLGHMVAYIEHTFMFASIRDRKYLDQFAYLNINLILKQVLSCTLAVRQIYYSEPRRIKFQNFRFSIN